MSQSQDPRPLSTIPAFPSLLHLFKYCEMASSTRELLQAHEAAFRAAVTSNFLVECKDGSIGANQFDAWLVQVRRQPRAMFRRPVVDGQAPPTLAP